MKIILPIHAKENEIVQIHWHCQEGVYIDRHTCPPKSTREVKQQIIKDETK